MCTFTSIYPVTHLYVCALRMNVTPRGLYLQGTCTKQQPVDKNSSRCLQEQSQFEVRDPAPCNMYDSEGCCESVRVCQPVCVYERRKINVYVELSVNMYKCATYVHINLSRYTSACMRSTHECNTSWPVSAGNLN